jgi:hypothetical protein
MRNVVFLKIVAVVLQQLLLCGDEFFQYLKTFDNIVEAIKDRVDLIRRDFHGSPSLKFDAYLFRSCSFEQELCERPPPAAVDARPRAWPALASDGSAPLRRRRRIAFAFLLPLA